MAKEPSHAEKCLWLARLAVEKRKGTSPADAVEIFRETIDTWKAVEDNKPPANDDNKPKAKTGA